MSLYDVFMDDPVKRKSVLRSISSQIRVIRQFNSRLLPYLFIVIIIYIEKLWEKRLCCSERCSVGGMSESSAAVAMTTTCEPEITSAKEVVSSLASTNTMTSSAQSVMEFYFSCAAIFIELLGTATNGLIIYALVASKQHQKNVGLLIFHQNAIDLYVSFFLVVIFSLKLCNIYLTGSVGYWLCTLLLSESLVWLGTCAVVINLASITIERYLKVVYPVWSKNKLRKWMLYTAMATAWIISFITNIVPRVPNNCSRTRKVLWLYDLGEPGGQHDILLLVYDVLHCDHDCYLHLLLLVHFGSHTSPGKGDGTRPKRRRRRRWIEPRAESRSNQRDQDHDYRHHILRSHKTAGHRHLLAYDATCRPDNFSDLFAREPITPTVVHVHQSVHLCHEVRPSQTSPAANDSLQEDLGASYFANRPCPWSWRSVYRT